MKVIILGVSGLIGHKLYQELNTKFEIYATLRKSKTHYNNLNLFDNNNIIENVEAFNFEKLTKILLDVNADVIINCIGITKRKKEINDPLSAITINSLFPHKIANWAAIYNKRVIHLSTDCVFDGKIGNYTEESLTTAEDVYGRTKALGEINYDHTLTIRSSFIGLELFSKTELLEWFLSVKKKTIDGFTNAMYSGVSTIFLTNVLSNIIENYPNLSGIRQLSIDKPISKFELLSLAKEAFGTKTEILPNDSIFINPTLNGNKLKKEVNYIVPSWKEMMHELANDKLTYQE